MFSLLIAICWTVAIAMSPPAFSYHIPQSQHHEDVFIGQPAHISGVVIANGRLDFSFLVDKENEIESILQHALRDAPLFETEEKVVLACYINGINVPRHEFEEGVGLIDRKIKGRCPFVCLYNATRGFTSDVQRLLLERKGVSTISKMALQNFLKVSFDYLSKYNPKFLLLILAHSEGGLLLEQAIDGLGDWGKEMAKKYLLIRTFGSVQPIKDETAVSVLNVYSDNDHAVFPFVRDKFHLHNYSFRFYQPSSHTNVSNAADHAFLGPTYQGALIDQIEALFAKHPPIFGLLPR